MLGENYTTRDRIAFDAGRKAAMADVLQFGSATVLDIAKTTGPELTPNVRADAAFVDGYRYVGMLLEKQTKRRNRRLRKR